MKETETIDLFMTRVLSIVAQFQTHGKPLEHKVVVQNILTSTYKGSNRVKMVKSQTLGL